MVTESVLTSETVAIDEARFMKRLAHTRNLTLVALEFFGDLLNAKSAFLPGFIGAQ